jgi:hypothetical protein
MLDIFSVVEIVLSAAVIIVPAVSAIYSKLENVAQRHEKASQKIVDAISSLQSSAPQLDQIAEQAKQVLSSLSNSQSESQ